MNLAVLDLETTRTDEHDGSILEIGCIITDEELRPLDQFETLVVPDMVHIAEMPGKVREMHTRSGLLDRLDVLMAERAGGRPHDGLLTLPDADAALAATLERWTVRGQVALAGSGVGHFDSRWIRTHLPASARKLTYWPIDVGVVRRWLSMIVGAEIPDPRYDEKPHRGMADARLHLAEAVRYRDAMRATVSVLNAEMARPRPGDRMEDGGEMGTLIRCETCGGGGLLHDLDRLPEIVEPQEG